MPTHQLRELMTARAQAAQSVTAEVSSLEDALRYAAELTLSLGGTTVAAAGFDAETLEVFKIFLGGEPSFAALRLLEPPFREQLSGIHTALTPADWGVAETGTLVLDSTSEDLRIATMLSEVHVAVLPLDRLRPDTAAVEGELRRLQEAPPRYLAFISGASRTADIERVLTIGVHGPQALHILFMEGPRP